MFTDSVDPDHTPQNAVSDQGLHCLSPVKQMLDTPIDIRIDLFNL